MSQGNGIDPNPDLDAVEMAISHYQRKKVVLHFQRPMEFVALEPTQAVEAGRKIIDCASECGIAITVNVPKRVISNEMRNRLLNRAVLIYTSMTDKRRAPKDIAREVVDSILSDID